MRSAVSRANASVQFPELQCIVWCIRIGYIYRVSPVRGDFIAAFQYVKEACKKDGDKLFSRACCDRTRGNGFKQREGRFRLDIRKTFFTIRVVKHWNRLPREVVDIPSLETFKVKSDGALNNLV